MASTEPDKDFINVLETIETLVAAKKDLPTIHLSHDRLSRMIDELAKRIQHDWLHNADRILLPCQVMSRLLKLYVALKDTPQAMSVWNTIADNKRVSALYSSPGCSDTRMHYHLLSIFSNLQSENINNQVVENGVVEAFDCHSETSMTQEEPSKTPTRPEESSVSEDDSSVSENESDQPSKASKPTKNLSWSIPVANARFPDKHLWGSCTALDYDHEAGTLVVQEVDKPKVKAGSKVSVEVRRLTHIRHDASKLHVRLIFKADGKYIVDLRMHTMDDGEDLVKKLKAIGPEEFQAGLQIGIVKNLSQIMDEREPVGAQKRNSVIESNGKRVVKKVKPSE
ncbi:MAG: hypothetical protein LQ348_004593 [Seirophora lacunosa]|nr:MAG: hypothetical protein LQ348_004593 [Seirophora lacunosa]